MDSIAVLVGVTIVAAASMLTEREEQAVPAFIADSRIRLDNARITANQWFAGAVRLSAAKTNTWLDRLIGGRLWSIRGINLILAAGALGLGFTILGHMLVMPEVAGNRLGDAILPCALVLGTMACCTRWGWGRWWLLLAQTAGVVALVAFMTNVPVALVTVGAWVLSSGLSFVTSRALLRRAALAIGPTTLLAVLVVDVVVTVLLFDVPLWIGDSYSGAMRANINAGTPAVLLNLSALVLTLVCTITAVSGLLHCAFWLAVVRPLYSLQRHWPLVSRKSLLVIGAAVFLAGCTGWYVLLLGLLPAALKAFTTGGPK